MFPQIDNEAHSLYANPNMTGSPERNLWMSVLERAILDYVGNDSKEVEAAEGWIFDDSGDNGDPYSFAWVCEQLDLDPKKIAATIKAMPKRGARRVAPWYFTKAS